MKRLSLPYLYIAMCLITCSIRCEEPHKNTADEKIIARWKKGGVIFEQPQFVVVDTDVNIKQKTIIGCGVHLLGNTSIGESCTIGHYTVIKNCIIGDNVHIKSHCVLENVIIKDGAEVGPFAHLQEGSLIEEKAVIGNFVEVKRSAIGPNTKAKHLSYLGDLTTEENVNIGAGTIVCNYDGVQKHKSTVGKHTSIGSNTCIIAPRSIGSHAITAAGSCITKDVPDRALAITRPKEQINKEEYAPELIARYQKQKAER